MNRRRMEVTTVRDRPGGGRDQRAKEGMNGELGFDQVFYFPLPAQASSASNKHRRRTAKPAPSGPAGSLQEVASVSSD